MRWILSLSDWSGMRQSYVARFAEPADLWTFYDAWRQEVAPETLREARFVHEGRAVRSIHPFGTREGALTWAAECIAKDRR